MAGAVVSEPPSPSSQTESQGAALSVSYVCPPSTGFSGSRCCLLLSPSLTLDHLLSDKLPSP